MHLFSHYPLKTVSSTAGHRRSLKRWPLMVLGILLLTVLQMFVATSQTLAAPPPTPNRTQVHPLNPYALQKALKTRIHVRQTGLTHGIRRPSTPGVPAYNNIGISDVNAMGSANFDGSGASYSAQDFSDPSGFGWNPGDTLTYQGIDYVWPAVASGQSDNYQAAGQVLPITPVAGATTLGFVGSAEEAYPSSSGTATLTYTDGTTSTFTLGMTDWVLDGGSAVPLASNRLFAVLPHINSSTQGQRSVSSYLFEMETTLTASKTLQSVTLPSSVNQGHLHIFMVGTRASTDIMNNVGFSDNATPQFANLDGAGASYSTQALTNANVIPGQSFFYNGIEFPWTASYSVIADNFQAAGQLLPVTPVANATTLAFLGAATNGAASGQVTITYTDGTTSTFTLGFADWNTTATSALPFGDQIAVTMPYRHTPAAQQNYTTYVFETEVSLQATKTLQSVTLPTGITAGQLHVFAVGTRSGVYNNVGTSNDGHPLTSNYDNHGDSYSLQSLRVAGIVPGQTVTVSGISFTWPTASAGLPDNYRTTGQVIPVAPVSNATTLAFLGSATNGNTAGQATITYTDGTTSTFTLGFADWNTGSPNALPFGDQIAFTTTYRNSPSGRQNGKTYVFFLATTISAGKTVQSVTLPVVSTSGQVHVFAVGLQ